MTKILSTKACGTYGHGPLKICPGKEKDDDHAQDSLKKDFLHICPVSPHPLNSGGGRFTP